MLVSNIYITVVYLMFDGIDQCADPLLPWNTKYTHVDTPKGLPETKIARYGYQILEVRFFTTFYVFN